MAGVTDQLIVDPSPGTTVEPPSEAVDTRPVTSPYTANISVLLNDGTCLYVPKSLLPYLPQHQDHLAATGIVRVPDEITLDVAHVLIHYLLTDTYQCLRPKGPSPQDRLSAEFDTGVRVLAAARAYDLPRLKELAHAELTRVGQEIPMPLVFRIVQEAFPEDRKKGRWLQAYLSARLEEFLQKPMKPMESKYWNEMRKTTHVDSILLAKLLELHGHDKTGYEAVDVQVPAPKQPEPVTAKPKAQESGTTSSKMSFREACDATKMRPTVPCQLDEDGYVDFLSPMCNGSDRVDFAAEESPIALQASSPKCLNTKKAKKKKKKTMKLKKDDGSPEEY
ncbi:hypothetical protein XA68_14492 [Ophiocordyceps unilateralis]|uniref:BTB domain-containing protein n=1 Tax=Ophiocordyceps unilateralis TaxID=268505 RepID=A0A2A9P8U2_OPHUN|nr:hypothetical protein XA68_14492 [Ophiocordyceps unilateralis]